MENDENVKNYLVNNEQEKKERKLDNLINIVENHTRTEKHLEQYSDISKQKSIEKAFEKQKVREEQIDELKEQLIGSNKNSEKQNYNKQDLKNNYKIGIEYYEEIENRIDNK